MTFQLPLVGEMELTELLVGVVDVTLVAYIIYRVLLLIRRTRAGYALVGLLVVAGVFLGAEKLNLATLRWLLDNIINYIILIVIIVFQADIRRGLMRVGRHMFGPSRVSDDVTLIEEICQACGEMAAKHTGALIVLERDVELSEMVEPGTRLDARLSKALLLNIFTAWPDNLLHDGAVLVQDGLIEQAGAVLPLSHNPGIDKALGTRHRAAVGITEETDALAVLVSEQRGSINLAVGGMLHTGLNPASLRRELLARLTVAGRPAWYARVFWRIEARFTSTDDKKAKSSKDAGAGESRGRG